MRAIDDDLVAAVHACKTILLSSLGLLLATAAWADGLELSFRSGKDGRGIDGSGLALRLGPLWAKDWGGWKFVLHPELELNRFRYDGSAPADGSDSLGEGAAIALLRLRRGDGRFGPYAEIGLGAAALSHVSLGSKRFSTGFQFTEQVGLGVEFPGGWFAGWRYSHYSNASIKTPNDGLDFHQIVIGVRF